MPNSQGPTFPNVSHTHLGVMLTGSVTLDTQQVQFGRLALTRNILTLHHINRIHSIPGRHPVGTCKMGRKKDPTAVVDSKLRLLNAY